MSNFPVICNDIQFVKLMGNDYNNMACCKVYEQTHEAVIDMDNLIFKDFDFNRSETYKKLQKMSRQFVKKQGLSQQYIPLISRIVANKQEHLIQAYRSIKVQKDKEKFIKSLEYIDIELVDSLFHNLVNKMHRTSTQQIAKPCEYVDAQMFSSDRKKLIFNKGLDIISNNKVGLLLLCGGSGRRFGTLHPKFIKETTLPSKKSILEILLLRLKKVVELANAKSKTVARQWTLNIFIMCNQLNYQAIKQFFIKIKYLGIPEKCIHFFLQGMIPVLNLKGQLCLTKDLTILESPNGCGQFLQSLVTFKMRNKVINDLGIKYLCVSGVENVLERPCDPSMLGAMQLEQAEVIAKCTDSYNFSQPFYRYVNINGKLKSINPRRFQDYICYDENKIKKSPIFMNSAIYDTSYLNRLLVNPQLGFEISRIFHIQKRPYSYIDVRDNKTPHDNQKCYIFEKNLSDLFIFSEKTILLKVCREEQFVPVLTQDGDYTLKQAEKALLTIHTKSMKSQQLSLSLLSKDEIQMI